jgi:hypothetical protein
MFRQLTLPVAPQCPWGSIYPCIEDVTLQEPLSGAALTSGQIISLLL